MTPQTLYKPASWSSDLIIEDTYKTPEGYKDFPYIYVYDGHNLTAGKDYRGLSVHMDGEAEFILRGIVGTDTIMAATSKFNFYTNYGDYKFSAPQLLEGNNSGTSTVPTPYPVVPEERYAPNGQIRFDLYNAQPVGGCSGLQNGTVLGFVGVKRMPANYCFYDTPYKYRKLPYTYKYSLTVDWAGVDASNKLVPPKTFVVPINDWDFELQRIRICPTSTGAAYNTFLMTLFDNARRATASNTLPWVYLVDQVSGPLAIFARGSFTVHPTPPLVYMVNGAIQFAIQSNYCSGDGNAPYTFDMCFDGVNRQPCM